MKRAIVIVVLLVRAKGSSSHRYNIFELYESAKSSTDDGSRHSETLVELIQHIKTHNQLNEKHLAS